MIATPVRRNGPWPNRLAWLRNNPFACACACAGVVLAGGVGVALAGGPSPAEVIRSLSVPRGIIVCVGEGATASALALARETEFLVFCQFADVATAEVERRIPVYGSLRSTWPAASGVRLQDGVAYVAAGIVNYDGTHVYALDAATCRIRWQKTPPDGGQRRAVDHGSPRGGALPDREPDVRERRTPVPPSAIPGV